MTINTDEFKKFVFQIALENAVNFKGIANPKALIGKCMPKFKDMKQNMKEYMFLLNEIVTEVNSINFEKQKEELLKLNPNFFNEKAEAKAEKKKNILELPELKNVNGKVRVRTEPAPSGRLHLGHTFNIIFNYEYKMKYGGEFILRFGDTNPDNIDLENYKFIEDDVRWLTNNGIDEIYYQSDRVNEYYKYLRELVEIEKAYICNCNPEIFKPFNDSSTPCPHRELPLKIQIKNYDKMFNGEFKSGEAVIRFKADLMNKNPALRDFPIARINTTKHSRVGNKHKVWPMMNLTVAVDDSKMNLTHVIRGKDHEINMLRQKMIHKELGMTSPEYFHIGRMKFEDIILSKTELTEKIDSGEFDGWDDPRVPSILSYRKRGYRAEAFRHLVLAGGLSKRDMKITSIDYHKALDYYNKQILENEANRYFYVHNPKKIIIENIEDINFNEIKINKHPELKTRGFRIFKVESEYLIDSLDFDNLNCGDNIRLMHFANFEIISKTENEMKIKFISKDYNKKLKVKRNIHFISSSNNEKVSLIMQDNSKLIGYCELIDNPKENTPMQFERFGFVKYDSKDAENNKIFYFTHR